MTELKDFMISPNRVMAFNACVMRLQVIGLVYVNDLGAKIRKRCIRGLTN